MMTHAKKLVKDVLYRIAPRWTTEWMSARSRAHSHKVVKEWGCPELNRKLIERFGDRVQEGPFAGTILTAMAAAEQLGPFLLGVYESELDSAWEVIRRGNYAQVVDIGAKFGYYAVGMARWFPRTRVVTFDTDWWARDAVREMAKANGVSERIDIRGYCDRAWLVNELQEAAFVLSDCEGFESQLFAAPIPDSLRTATLLIELHEDVVPNLTASMRHAFDRTHRMTLLETNSMRRGSSLDLSFLSEADRRLANREVRGTQCWLLCLPNAGPNKALGMPGG